MYQATKKARAEAPRFSSEWLRRAPSHSAIARLYARAGFVCSQCDEHFDSRALLAAHLDAHYEMVQRRKRGDPIAHAFVDPVAWIHETPRSQPLPVPPRPTPPEQPQEIIDNGQSKCPRCHETFRRVWSDAQDAWVLVGAALDVRTGLVLHSLCR